MGVPESSCNERAASARGAHAPSRVAIGAHADGFPNSIGNIGKAEMWPARAPATPREARVLPRVIFSIQLSALSPLPNMSKIRRRSAAHKTSITRLNVFATFVLDISFPYDILIP